MKKILLSIVFVLMLCPLYAEWDVLPPEISMQLHQDMLKKCSLDAPQRAEFRMVETQYCVFSAFEGESQITAFARDEANNYLLHAIKDSLNGNVIVSLDFYIAKDRVESVVKTKLLYSAGKMDFQIKAEDTKQFKAEILLQIASKIAESENWEGIFECDPLTLERTTYYKTKAEAVRHVPQHVSPKDCFVWGSGSKWMVIPGTGCAHWVAHQKGIKNGAGCYTGNSIRVRDVVSGKSRNSIRNARVGDIWTNSDLSHCGIVRKVNSGSVKVQHCSSGSGGVVYSNFTSGYCYR